MRTEAELTAIAEQCLAAWNTHDVPTVLACYTEDVEYLDPNTRGVVTGHAALECYLGELFGQWLMHWQAREVFPLADGSGAAVLWTADLTQRSSGQSVRVDGMDLAVLRGDRLARNEVYFDRVALAPLLAGTGGKIAS